MWVAADEANAAYHEAGHALANVLAFRHVWPKPSPLVRLVEITRNTDGEWVGGCSDALRNYEYLCPTLLERQVICHLAGGIAEAIYRGERRREWVLDFATRYCCMDTDRQRANAAIDELRQRTGVSTDEYAFAERARRLLLTHWPAVDALAGALVEDLRIVGDEVEAIIERAC